MILRSVVSGLISVAAVLAQDPARMAQVAEAQASEDRFMGVVLVAKGDTILFEHAYGSANLEWEVPNTSSTKFRIGSVTKQFTAAAILLLEERGQLSTDDPVSTFVPDAPPAWEDITVYHLLTHTSGIPSFTGFPEYGTWKLTSPDAARNVAQFRDRPLEFSPGERFAYSNSGYALLGYIIERVSGQSYETFVQENLLKPLGLNDSGYDWNARVVPRRAAGYVRGPNGLANAPYIDMHVPHAAGALYSTARDLLRWTQGLFGGKLLSAASLVKLTTPGKSSYACGLVVRTSHGRKVIEHGGGIEGFNAQLAYYPEDEVTVVVLANVNGPAAGELSQQLAAVALGAPVTLPSEREAIELPRNVLERFVGSYELRPGLVLTITLEGDRLMSQATGQAKHALFSETPTKFFLRVVDAQLEFLSDATGAVTQAVLHQGGQELKAPRLRP